MSKRNPTIREMVEHRLRADGFDGLWQCGGECACELGDLFPCGEPNSNCNAGYRGPCTGMGCAADGDCDFHIGPNKEKS